MQIEKLNDTEAEIVTRIPATEKRERINLDELNLLIEQKTAEIESYKAQAQSILDGVDNLKAEKAALVAKKKALKDLGMKTQAELLPPSEVPVEVIPPEAV